MVVDKLDFGVTFQRLPEVQFVTNQQFLLNTPLMFSLESSATAFRTEELRNGRKADFDVNRFNFSPEISLPLSLTSWFSLTPLAGFHETYYSKDNRGGGSFGREYYNLQLKAEGPKVFRFFQSGGGGGDDAGNQFKHLITPTVEYNYIPDHGFDGDDRERVPVFDNIDSRGNPENSIRYGISNRILKKEVTGVDDFETREILRFGVFQTYDIREGQRNVQAINGDRTPFSEFFLDLDTRIWKSFLFNVDSLYDVHEADFTSINFELGYLLNDYAYVSYDRRYTSGVGGSTRNIFSNLLVGGQPFPWLRAEVGLIYNEMEEELTDGLFSFTYLSDCWSLTVDYYDRVFIPDNTPSSLVDQFKDRESKIFFSLGLKGIGDFGRLKERFLHRKL